MKNMAVHSFVCVSAFPAPMVFGYIIDQACLVTQTSCTRKGACLLYDADRFRYMLHGLPVVLKLCSLVVFTSGFFWSRNNDKKVARKKAEEREMLPPK